MGRIGGLANVAGAVLCDESSDAGLASAIAELLAKICQNVLVVGRSLPEVPGRAVSASDGTRLGLLVAALEAAEAPRLLVVETSSAHVPPPALLLALTAWPESDVVRPGKLELGCAIYRRESVLVSARQHLADGDDDWMVLFQALQVVEVEGRDLEALIAAP